MDDPGAAQLGSVPSAACGRYSEVSEWQRSIADEVALATRKISGAATGSAPALGAGTLNRFDFLKCCILPFIFANTLDYFR